MKKKVIVILALFTFIFIVGGTYIILTIERATTRLNNLITLHQVEILREHLLIQIKRVQSDLSLHKTRYARGVDSMVSNVRNMERIVNTCFDCHHQEDVEKELENLRSETFAYKSALSKVFTYRAQTERLNTVEDHAFRTGEKLIGTLNEIITFAQMRLDRKTQLAIEEIAKTKKVVFLLIAIGPFLTIALMTMFVRGFTKPMGLLLDATRKLKGGALDHRIKGLKYEFGELAGSFNEMAGSLKSQMQKMQRTEQMVVCGEMTTRLAHEIKNPLAGIKLSMEVLSGETSITEDDKNVLQKVIKEVERVEQMIRSLLTFARPAAPQFMKVNVCDILEKTLSRYRKYTSPALDRSGKITVVRDFGKDLPEISADPFQVQQACLNLLLNASDAMPDGGTLTVKVRHDKVLKHVQIEVSDTGSGIESKLMDRLFQPFFSTKPKGTGLGLSIIRQIVEQHDGLISVRNNGDVGATFKISFPVNIEKEETQTV